MRFGNQPGKLAEQVLASADSLSSLFPFSNPRKLKYLPAALGSWQHVCIAQKYSLSVGRPIQHALHEAVEHIVAYRYRRSGPQARICRCCKQQSITQVHAGRPRYKSATRSAGAVQVRWAGARYLQRSVHDYAGEAFYQC